jgi:hypothetical protein
MQLGIVSGRVALLLRSTEIQPVLLRFVSGLRANPLPPLRETRPGRVGLLSLSSILGVVASARLGLVRSSAYL